MEANIHIHPCIHELLIASHQGIEQLTRKLSLLTKHPIIIADSLFRIRASTFMEEVFPDNEFLPMEKGMWDERETLFVCETVYKLKPLYSIGTRIKMGHNTLGYIFLMNDSPMNDMEQYEEILTYSASLYAFNFERRFEIKKERQKFKEVFLFNLLYGNIKDREDIIEYGELWKWDFKAPHVVIVFSIKDFDYFTDDKQYIHSLLETIEVALLGLKIKPITLVKQNEIIVLLPMDVTVSASLFLNQFISQVFNKVEDTHLEDRIACGVGTIYDNPIDIFRSYQEAKIAFDLGTLLTIEIPHFNQLGLERILYKHDMQDLKEFYQHTLGDLITFDQANDTDYLKMLEMFSINGFDMSKTSEELFLHRNTLRYRLKRVEEILNIKLDDMNTRLNILAAFKIRSLRKL